METVPWDLWPILIAIGIVLIAAALQLIVGAVPNQLTLTMVVLGWAAALLIGPRSEASPQVALAASFLSTVTALLILLPFYCYGLGAGCVKTQMAFGAWIGCALPIVSACTVTAIATVLAVATTYIACGVVAALGMIDDESGKGQFPAQVTQTLGAVAGVAVWYFLGTVI